MSTNYGLFMPRSTSGNFPRIFGIFGVFSVPCKHFLEFPNLFLLWKIFRKNLILPYLGRARTLDPVRFGPARQSPSGPGQAAAVANLGVRTKAGAGLRPYLSQGRVSPRALAAAATLALGACSHRQG
jgi:hypothetical protein